MQKSIAAFESQVRALLAADPEETKLSPGHRILLMELAAVCMYLQYLELKADDEQAMQTFLCNMNIVAKKTIT